MVHSLLLPLGSAMEYYRMLRCLASHIGTERNRRLKQYSLKHPDIRLKEVIKDINLFFRLECHKKSCRHPLESTTIQGFL